MQPEKITSKGTWVSCAYYQQKCPFEKRLETYLMILEYIYIYIYIYTKPCARVGYPMKSFFLRILTSLYSKFSFSEIRSHTKVKEPILPYLLYLVTKFSHLSFGVYLSGDSWRISNLYLTFGVYGLLISIWANDGPILS